MVFHQQSHLADLASFACELSHANRAESASVSVPGYEACKGVHVSDPLLGIGAVALPSGASQLGNMCALGVGAAMKVCEPYEVSLSIVPVPEDASASTSD